jgi:CheY-like chemotaxis protein
MILFIDDDTFGMKPYKLALEDANLHPIVVSTPDEALAVLQSDSTKIKLIILDVLMPTGSSLSPDDTNGGLATGYLLLERIRQGHAHIPIIVFSITSASDLKNEYVEDNVTFMNKQDTLPSELVSAVRRKLIAS